ncbi:hypothetical protein JCM8208_006444 [Rhodotorula glutinis]
MADAPNPKPVRSSTNSKGRQNSPPPYRSHAETSMEDFVNEFWQHAMNVAEHHEDDFKHQALPLARIKKVAKMDPEVQQQMISSEVTVLFEKACQVFIQEVTARAHLVSLAARRRTLSRADVAQAVSRSDMFDFLIDIVPRNEQRAAASTSDAVASGSGTKRRARKPSQRSPTLDGASADVAVGAEGVQGGAVSGSEDDSGEPSVKRMRFLEGQVDQQQQGAGHGQGMYVMSMDAANTQAQAQAQAAQAATFYMQPDGTPAFTAEGDLPWPSSFGFPAARTVPDLQGFYQQAPPSGSGPQGGEQGAGHGE